MSSVTTEQIELEWWSNGARNALDGLATTHNDLAREFFVFCAYAWAVKAAHHARRLLKLTGEIPEDE